MTDNEKLEPIIREQIAKEIKQHCVVIGHWHIHEVAAAIAEPNMPCQRGEK